MYKNEAYNLCSVIYREEEVHKGEIERLFLAGKCFNTNLVHFISNMHVCSFTGMISQVRNRASKTVLRAQNLVYKKL